MRRRTGCGLLARRRRQQDILERASGREPKCERRHGAGGTGTASAGLLASCEHPRSRKRALTEQQRRDAHRQRSEGLPAARARSREEPRKHKAPAKRCRPCTQKSRACARLSVRFHVRRPQISGFPRAPVTSPLHPSYRCGSSNNRPPHSKRNAPRSSKRRPATS